MNAIFPGFAAYDSNIVYIRPVKVADLPDDVRAFAEGASEVYSVHSADGEQVALVREKGLAFYMARHNNLTPVNVH